MHKNIEDGRKVALITSEMPNRCDELHNFLEHQTKIVITTNLFERVIDNPNVCLVINFTAPIYNEKPDVKVYEYQAGRTGRFGKPGAVLTFVEPRSVDIFKRYLRFELRVHTTEI